MASRAAHLPARAGPSGGLGARRWLAAHPLVAYLIRRFILYLVTLWGALTVTFIFFRLIPGDPIQAFMTSLEQQYVYNQQASQEVIEHYRKVFGLEGNLLQQYLHYLNQVLVTRDLGPALLNFPTPAQVIILRALPWTIGLLGLSAVVAWTLGLLLGAVVGWSRGAVASEWITNVAIALSHIPYYFVALMMVFLFAYRLAWFPSSSAYDPNLQPGLDLEFVLSVIRYGFLPAVSIVVIGVCNWMISTRTLLVTTLGEDYLTFADAKGLHPRRILTQYALRNCYLPQVTAFGISLGFIFNGNVLVEQLFKYPGIGNLLVTALGILDYNTIQGIVAITIVAVLTANLVIDLLLPLLDPRVKYWR
ncbi:MAG TPA: ABC transporter permease [Chloroflexota bacterium]|jgi:peptide/nickel transport system permease protein|nr:ABC transporter permease [Chloroflexota bacterium]